MAKRGRQPKFERVQIQKAAREIILQNGLEGLTMSRLARELRTSASALYRYYASKEVLMVDLQVRAIGSIEKAITAALEQHRTLEPGTTSVAVSALRRCILAFDVYAEWGNSSERGLIDAFLSQPKPVLSLEQAKQVNQRLAGVLAICVQTLDDAVAAKAVYHGDNVQRTHILWAALHGLGHFKKRDRVQPDQLQSLALKDALYTALFIGFGAERSRIETALERTR